MMFDLYFLVVLNFECKCIIYFILFLDKLEMIVEYGIDYCIVINFLLRFVNVIFDDFIKNYIINNYVKEVIVGFDFIFGKFGKGNMMVF